MRSSVHEVLALENNGLPGRLLAMTRLGGTLLAAAVGGACWAGDGRPGWMPDRPSISSAWYDAALGRSAQTIAIERPDRIVPKGREMVLATTFTQSPMREWAALATQVDVIDYEIVVLHAPRGPAPADIEAKLVGSDPSLPDVVRTGLVDGRWAFVLRDGTWVLAAMGYVDRVRALLLGSRPPRLSIPSNVSQLVLISRPGLSKRPPCSVEHDEIACAGPVGPTHRREGLEWIVIATKTDGSYVTHAHYSNEEAVETAPRANPSLTVEAYQHGAELYTRGY